MSRGAEYVAVQWHISKVLSYQTETRPTLQRTLLVYQLHEDRKKEICSRQLALPYKCLGQPVHIEQHKLLPNNTLIHNCVHKVYVATTHQIQ